MPGRACSSSPCSIAAPWFVGRVARACPSGAPPRSASWLHRRPPKSRRASRRRSPHERVRIGRELQDIIAHSVSAMVIQAGGARQLLRTEPERARDSILTVERTGREALADLRRLLGMLRKDDDPRALAPQPGLDQLASARRVDPRGRPRMRPASPRASRST